MEETKGVVSKIFQNETKAGKPYWVLSMRAGDGGYVRYSVWDWKSLEGIHEGDTITYRFEQKNGYNNITEILKTEKASNGNDEAMAYAFGGRVEQIARMSAIKSATQLLSGYNGDPQDKMSKTLEAAKEFEKYIFGVLESSKDNGDGQPTPRRKSRKKESASAEAQTIGPGNGDQQPAQPSGEKLPF